MALRYHSGQIELQDEANTRPVAEMLSGWVGPVGEFTGVADIVLLATRDADADLRFSVVSGPAPLVEVIGHSRISIPDLHLPTAGPDRLAGGLAICLAQRRRARINGRLAKDSEGWTLEFSEAFTNCRKYIAPSVALQERRHSGAAGAEPLAYSDPWLRELLARAETAFLASVSPDGLPDVSHRGGPPGYLELDASRGVLSWPEYVGDGMFKSAGNVRATGRATLLVLDLLTGDAAELIGEASYRTLRTQKQARTDALLSGKVPFPVQGEMTLSIRRALKIRSIVAPRQRLEKTEKVTSCSSIDDQAPQ